MKIKNLLLGLGLLTGVFTTGNVVAQEKSEACKDASSLGYDAISNKEWNFAIEQYLIAIKECPADADVYGNMLYAMTERYATLEGDSKKNLGDSIVTYYEEMFTKTGYDVEGGAYYAQFLQSNEFTTFDKIDTLFTNYIQKFKEKSSGAFTTPYYANLYMLYANEKDAAKATEYKTRFLEDYLLLSEYNAKSEMDDATKASIANYFDSYFFTVAKECSDILPVVKNKLANLPEDKEALKKDVQNFMQILEKKKCTDSDEYAELLKISVEKLEPTPTTMLSYGMYLYDHGKKSEGLAKMKEAANLETDPTKKAQMNYNVLVKTYSAGRYKEAFNLAKGISGAQKGDAILIQAKCIAATAMSSGVSTFERKSNYWLAVDYAKKAQAAGASASSSIAKWCGLAPTIRDAFSEGFQEGSSVNCATWGESTKVRKCN